ncbi:MAG: hypothetical protein IAI50_17480, partial [Candidatus Eremiobacteraeota bacterium]|nr:hypothetical protein [Candidatus Eremiobacteraeota bacterium]
ADLKTRPERDPRPARPHVRAREARGATANATSAALAFEEPDFERFPCLGLAYEALRRGGTVPAALSAANEIAVAAFVGGRIDFGTIPRVVAAALGGTPDEALSLESVRSADARARVLAQAAVEARAVASAK